MTDQQQSHQVVVGLDGEARNAQRDTQEQDSHSICG